MDYVGITLKAVEILVPALLAIWILSTSVVYIGNGSYGVVEKLWTSPFGKKRTSFIALNGEAGYQAELLSGGFHMFFPGQYRIHKKKLITVKGIAYLFARDGRPMTEGQALAAWPKDVEVGDARAFLQNGGEQGPQRHILRQGLYAINTALHAVFTEEGIFTIDVGDIDVLEKIDEKLKAAQGYDPIVLDKDSVGIVTVNDGLSLEHGEIVAPTVKKIDHNSFQSIEKFIEGGGRRGRQEQVMVEGTYYINRLAATVEVDQKEIIPIGFVGVVNSYAGEKGDDVSGADFTHGKLVKSGEKGIWSTPWLPGKYAINRYAMSVKQIPTTNLVLRWKRGSSELHGYDRNLEELSLITKDAFEPVVGVSMVIHISQENAPFVVQQFADVQQMVDQTLDTIVSSWFKDAVQKKTLVELINERAEIQQEALAAIKERFKPYHIEVQEIVLGTPRAKSGDTSIEGVYDQLRDRQLAAEQMTTFEARRAAADTERTYNESAAIAANQAQLTASNIQISIATNEGAAKLARQTKEAEATVLIAKAEAEKIEVTAAAEAKKTEVTGAAEAKKIEAIGAAEASAAKAQVEAYGGEELAMRKAMVEIVSNAIMNSTQPIVPQIVMGGEGKTASLPELLSSVFLGSGQLPALLNAKNGATATGSKAV